MRNVFYLAEVGKVLTKGHTLIHAVYFLTDKQSMDYVLIEMV